DMAVHLHVRGGDGFQLGDFDAACHRLEAEVAEQALVIASTGSLPSPGFELTLLAVARRA
ncbi:MAG: hypothetical protein L0H23_13390, partial [Luteimonas sp.]|nr:hypothetical protein [Luteimonas sp.]